MKPCPACRSGGVEIAPVFVATDGVLAGSQLKVTAVRRWRASCTACDWSVDGRLVDAVLDEDGQFVGGHFEVSR